VIDDVLVDTSVWIDHLRRGRPELRASLEADEVVCHPFVVGELACGTIKRRDEVLSLLTALPQATVADHAEVMHLIETHQLIGKGIGWIDAHLLASTRLDGETLWTLDGALKKAARIVGVSLA
jgi:predicted nucleic acid-binding protein